VAEDPQLFDPIVLSRAYRAVADHVQAQVFREHVHRVYPLFAGTAAGYGHALIREVAEVMASNFGLKRPQ